MDHTTKRRRTTTHLEAILKLCEKHNVLVYSDKEMRLEFKDSISYVGGRKQKQQGKTGKEHIDRPDVDMPADDLMMFASSPVFEDLIADRAEGLKE